MRILRLRAYCYPESVSASAMGEELDNAFAANDFVCINYTPTPSRGVSEETRKEYKKKKYEELNDGRIVIHRFPMIKETTNVFQKSLKYLLCTVVEYVKGVKSKEIDLVFGGSTPPTQGMLSAAVAKKLSKKYGRKVPFVFCLQDIFPDSLVNAGMTTKGSLLWKLGRKIENYIYKNADKIIVINRSFKNNIMAKGVPAEKIEVISNWINLESVYPIARKDNKLISEFGIAPEKFIVVYAGNFGAAQGAGIVLKAAQELKNHDHIQFVIFGAGTYFETAKREAEGLSNVFIHELMPQNRISEVYSLGDVALITCKKGIGTSGMPSKLWSIMACNTPIIASFDTDSELADVLRESASGVCVEPENVYAFAEAILHASQTVSEKKDLRAYVEKHASRDNCLKRYIQTIQDCCIK